MKNFFKKNLWLIATLLVAVICFLFSSIWIGFLFFGSIVAGSVSLFYGIKLRRKYKDLLSSPVENDDYFDATKYDYDEDVYYVGNASQHNKKIGKSFLSKLNTYMPSLILILFGLGFIFIAVTGVIKMFI